MTFLEKFKEDLPSAPLNEEGVPECCPFSLGYEKDVFCDRAGNEYKSCKVCWTREIPKTYLEKLLEVFPQTLLGEFGTPHFCPHFIGLKSLYKHCSTATVCRECWSQLYEGEN